LIHVVESDALEMLFVVTDDVDAETDFPAVDDWDAHVRNN